MNNEIITFKLAKIVKDRGFKNNVKLVYDIDYPKEPVIEIGNIIGDAELYAPTYYQLINWIFEWANTIECDLKDNVEWLSFWYNILINPMYCPHCNNGDLELVDNHYQCTNCNSTFNIHDKTWIKDCPLKYEFKGRLLEWFRSNNISLDIKYLNSGLYNYYIRYINDEEDKFIELVWKNKSSYKKAERQGILEIFKLMKNNYE